MINALPTCELNMRCAGVKRLLKEAYELRVPNELFFTKPMDDNLFEWHFSIRGPPDTVYQNGIYHGRIILPAEYPMKPPNMILLTPNGRFETNKKICLSISGYHPETWLPSWSIRTALLALVGFMPSHSGGAIGGLECSDVERKKLAIKSLDWRCVTCDCTMRDVFPISKKFLPPLVNELVMTAKEPLSNQLTTTSKKTLFTKSQAFSTQNKEFISTSTTSLNKSSNPAYLTSLSEMVEITKPSTPGLKVKPVNSVMLPSDNRCSNKNDNINFERSQQNMPNIDIFLSTSSINNFTNWTTLLSIIICLITFAVLLYRRINV